MNDLPVEIKDRNAGEWTEHPRFQGILMKSLLTPAENSLANVNTVRVPPGGVIGSHGHASQVETIYVLAGKSILTIRGVDIPFSAGQVVAVSIGMTHSLRNEGTEIVELLTIFTPPL